MQCVQFYVWRAWNSLACRRLCLLVFLPGLLLEPLGSPIPRHLGPSVIKFLKTPLARVSWTSWDMCPFLATPLFTIWSLTYYTVVCCPKSSVDSKQFLNSLTCAVVKAAKFCCLAIPDSFVSLLIGVYSKLMRSTLWPWFIEWKWNVQSDCADCGTTGRRHTVDDYRRKPRHWCERYVHQCRWTEMYYQPCWPIYQVCHHYLY